MAIHRLELGLGLRWSGGKQGRRGWLTSLNVPLLLSTSCWEFFGHLISLSCTHVIKEGNGLLVVVSLWSPCRVPTSLNEGRGDDMAATWRLCGGSVAAYGAVTWQTTPLLLNWSPSHEGPARTRPHMSTCCFPQSRGRREGNGSRVMGWKKHVINN